MAYVLGIDQGGTKTCAAVMDGQGKIISYGKAGGCYFPRDGMEAAMRFVSDAAATALNAAQISIADIDAIVAGITGIDWSGDEILVAKALEKLFGNKQITACNDCEIAYYSGAQKAVGAVICAGTGINAAIFTPDNRQFVMGDYLKGSLQGGSAIATRAIEAVFESDLGMRPETKLTKLFLDFSGDGSIYELLRRYMTKKDFTGAVVSLVPQIIGAADSGDQVAAGVLTEFSDELCATFAAALKKMDMLKTNCDIVLAGSVFKGYTNSLTDRIVKRLSSLAPNADIIHAKFDPIVGACVLHIMRQPGKPVEQMLRNAAASAGALGLLQVSPGSEDPGGFSYVRAVGKQTVNKRD